MNARPYLKFPAGAAEPDGRVVDLLKVHEDTSSSIQKLYLTYSDKRTFTYFVRGRITVRLTSCLTGLDLAEQLNMLLMKYKQGSWIQIRQTGGQPYSDTSPYEIMIKLNTRFMELNMALISIQSLGRSKQIVLTRYPSSHVLKISASDHTLILKQQLFTLFTYYNNLNKAGNLKE